VVVEQGRSRTPRDIRRQAAADREFGDRDSAEPDSRMRRGCGCWTEPTMDGSVGTGIPANVCLVVVVVSQRLAS
jgi:hypothetical protein